MTNLGESKRACLGNRTEPEILWVEIDVRVCLEGSGEITEDDTEH